MAGAVWSAVQVSLFGSAIMLFAPQGVWGLFVSRTGIQLLPIRRLLRGGLLDN